MATYLLTMGWLAKETARHLLNRGVRLRTLKFHNPSSVNNNGPWEEVVRWPEYANDGLDLQIEMNISPSAVAFLTVDFAIDFIVPSLVERFKDHFHQETT